MPGVLYRTIPISAQRSAGWSSGYQHEIVRSIDILACMTLARGGRLLDDMMNFIAFLGLADAPLQLFERFAASS